MLSSGSTAWQETLDMDALPQWLITAGQVGARVSFHKNSSTPVSLASEKKPPAPLQSTGSLLMSVSQARTQDVSVKASPVAVSNMKIVPMEEDDAENAV